MLHALLLNKIVLAFAPVLLLRNVNTGYALVCNKLPFMVTLSAPLKFTSAPLIPLPLTVTPGLVGYKRREE